MQDDNPVVSGLCATLPSWSSTASLPARPALALCLYTTALAAVMATPTFIFGMDPLSLTLTGIALFNAALASLAFRELFYPQDHFLYLSELIAELRNKVDVMEWEMCCSRVQIFEYLNTLSR